MSDVISVQLPDGSSREVPAGTTTYDLALSIGPRLAKDAVIGVVEGVEVDLDVPLHDGASVEIVTGDTERGLHTIRHSTAHVMAQAILDLYPGTQLAIGPPVEFGFYYDVELPEGKTLSDDDLAQIKARMQEIVKADQAFERHELPAAEAAAPKGAAPKAAAPKAAAPAPAPPKAAAPAPAPAPAPPPAPAPAPPAPKAAAPAPKAPAPAAAKKAVRGPSKKAYKGPGKPFTGPKEIVGSGEYSTKSWNTDGNTPWSADGAGGRLGKTQHQQVETGQKEKRNVKHDGYYDDIEDGSHSGFLPQWDPKQQHQRTYNECCEADAPSGVKRDTLCEHRPGTDAGTRRDQQRLAKAEDDKPDDQQRHRHQGRAKGQGFRRAPEEGWNGFDLQKTHGLVLSGCNLADAPVLQPKCEFYLEIASPVGLGKYFTQFTWRRNHMGRIRPSCSSGNGFGTGFAQPD